MLGSIPDTIPTVLSLLRTHGLVSQDVAQAGCLAVEWMAAGTPVNARALVSGGGIIAIISVMEKHMSANAVAPAACGALYSLSIDGDAALGEMRACGVSTLLHTLRKLYPKEKGNVAYWSRNLLAKLGE